MTSFSQVFEVITIVNDWNRYAQMQASFKAAGFVDELTRFTPMDNCVENAFDPYRTIDSLLESSNREPYVILCHQDVLVDQGHTFADLLSVLDELTTIDPNWAVAGNAGCTDSFEFVLQVVDPNGFNLWNGKLPIEVHSLDENFLVFRRSAKFSTSPQLSGFHLYGTDVCLNARKRGFGCYVIPFVVTHLSAGRFDSSFFDSKKKFIERWNKEFRCAWIVREAEFFVSRFKLFRWLGDKSRAKSIMRKSRLARLFFNRELSNMRRPG